MGLIVERERERFWGIGVMWESTLCEIERKQKGKTSLIHAYLHSASRQKQRAKGVLFRSVLHCSSKFWERQDFELEICRMGYGVGRVINGRRYLNNFITLLSNHLLLQVLLSIFLIILLGYVWHTWLVA